MIYLISSSKYIKIGFTNNKKDRFCHYVTCNPDFKILDIFEEGTKKDESNLHKILAEYTYRGEWMYYNDDIIENWNNYTKHNVQTLSKIEKSKFELEIAQLTNRILKAEQERNISNYQKHFIIKHLELYYKYNKSKLIEYVKKVINEYNLDNEDRLAQLEEENKKQRELIKKLLDNKKIEDASYEM